MAITDTIALLILVVTWGCWAGVRVNLSKSGCAAHDYAKCCKISVEQIFYRGLSLPELHPDKPFLYLGMLLTLTLNFSFEKDRIMKGDKRVRRNPSQSWLPFAVAKKIGSPTCSHLHISIYRWSGPMEPI